MAYEYTTITVDMSLINNTTENGTLKVYWYGPIVLANGDTIAANPRGRSFTVTAGAATITLAATDAATVGTNLPYKVTYTGTADTTERTLGLIYVLTSATTVTLASLLAAATSRASVLPGANIDTITGFYTAASTTVMQQLTGVEDGERCFVEDVGIYRAEVPAVTPAVGYRAIWSSDGETGWVLEEDGADWRPVFDATQYGLVVSASSGVGGANTTALLAAIDAAYTAGNGVVLIPPASGVYWLSDLVYLKPGVTIQGYGATCKRVPSSYYAGLGTWTSGTTYAVGTAAPASFVVNSAGNLYYCTTAGGGAATVEPTHTSGAVTGADGYGWTYSNYVKFRRMFSCDASLWSSSDDSAPITIQGLTLDGNLGNQGTATSSLVEQQHLIYLSASTATPTLAGRLRARVENVTFQNCEADGISLRFNTDVEIVNCRAYNCRRSGLSVTGGWNKVAVTNWQSAGTTYTAPLNVEVDAKGYDGTSEGYRLDMVIDGMILEDGGFDFAQIATGTGTLLCSNLITKKPSFTYYGGGTYTARFVNCDIMVGLASGSVDHLRWPGNVTFESTTFRMYSADDSTAAHYLAHIYWQNAGTTTDQRVRFQNCRFLDNSAVSGTSYGIYTRAEPASRNNWLEVVDCEFFGGFDMAYRSEQGGNAVIRDTMVDGATGAYQLVGTNTYPCNLVLDNARCRNTTTWFTISSNVVDNTVTFRNIRDLAANLVTTISAGGDGNLTVRYGHVERIVSATPTAGGLRGDIAILNPAPASGVNRWVCTAGHSTAATWKVFEDIPLTGSATWNPPNLASGASQSTTVTVTGAALGDRVDPPVFSLDLAGTTLVGYVSAADTVTVVQSNLTGGAVDLASGTLSVRVRKAS